MLISKISALMESIDSLKKSNTSKPFRLKRNRDSYIDWNEDRELCLLDVCIANSVHKRRPDGKEWNSREMKAKWIKVQEDFFKKELNIHYQQPDTTRRLKDKYYSIMKKVAIKNGFLEKVGASLHISKEDEKLSRIDSKVKFILMDSEVEGAIGEESNKNESTNFFRKETEITLLPEQGTGITILPGKEPENTILPGKETENATRKEMEKIILPGNEMESTISKEMEITILPGKEMENTTRKEMETTILPKNEIEPTFSNINASLLNYLDGHVEGNVEIQMLDYMDRNGIDLTKFMLLCQIGPDEQDTLEKLTDISLKVLVNMYCSPYQKFSAAQFKTDLKVDIGIKPAHVHKIFAGLSSIKNLATFSARGAHIVV